MDLCITLLPSLDLRVSSSFQHVIVPCYLRILTLKCLKDLFLDRFDETLKCPRGLYPAFRPMCRLSSCTLLFISFALPVRPAPTLIDIKAAVPESYGKAQMLFWRVMLVTGDDNMAGIPLLSLPHVTSWAIAIA